VSRGDGASRRPWGERRRTAPHVLEAAAEAPTAEAPADDVAAAPVAGERYGSFWRPADVSAAMLSILSNDDTELFEQSGRAQAEALVALLPSADATVVDLGCGIGRVAKYLAPRCKLLWGVDVSAEMLEMAAERLAGIPNVRFSHCADTRIPEIADASVDFVYAVLVLQHLEREDTFLMLREIRRILRPGGTAYLGFPNLLSDVYLRSFVAYAESGEAATNPVRARAYTPQEVERLLPAAGLTVVTLEATVDIVAVVVRNRVPEERD
jgi:ubiquinone/menaquinone biosynthesis C-methylase UbiE